LKNSLLLSIIIPVYNERETTHDIIAAVEATPFRKEIIAVDHCSTDGTRDLLAAMQNENLRVFTREALAGL